MAAETAVQELGEKISILSAKWTDSLFAVSVALNDLDRTKTYALYFAD